MIPHAAVEDTMADIACVFHWPLSDLAAMDLAELHDWHARARARSDPKAER